MGCHSRPGVNLLSQAKSIEYIAGKVYPIINRNPVVVFKCTLTRNFATDIFNQPVYCGIQDASGLGAALETRRCKSDLVSSWAPRNVAALPSAILPYSEDFSHQPPPRHTYCQHIHVHSRELLPQIAAISVPYLRRYQET